MTSPPTLPSLDDAIHRRGREMAALLLWEAGAIRVSPDEPFELASGNRSPIYVNCRQVISSPLFMQLFTALAGSLCQRQGVTFGAAAGGETAGIPFAAYLARDLGARMLYVRKKTKGYGLASKVEGEVRPGESVLLVEDLITDGGSKLGFIEALRQAGGRLEHALVLFDREQGGEATLARQGVTLHSVTGMTTALEVAEAEGLVSSETGREIRAYFDDPAGWHRARGLEYLG